MLKQILNFLDLTKDYIKNLDKLSAKELIPYTKAWDKIGSELLQNKRSASVLLVELGYDGPFSRAERRKDDLSHTIILNRLEN